jgi:ubiquinone biosynthesis protein
MKKIQTLSRLLKIQKTLIYYQLDEFIADIPALHSLRWIFYLSPRLWFRKTTSLSRGERLRCALEHLGPLYVKFGQSLSTRPDLLPEDIATELSKLQDDVPAFSSDLVEQEILKAFGQPSMDVFTNFDSDAFASASIAQAHLATLKSGEEVIVKILRPNIWEAIEKDMEILILCAKLINNYSEESKRLRPIEVVSDYQTTVLHELDLVREAANCAQIGRNCLDSEIIKVPKIYWDYCKTNILVQERIHGIPINNLQQLKAAGVNIEQLAINGVQIFFTQVFRDNFFHADMHPGNIFVVSGKEKELPIIKVIDFGIMCSLTEYDQHYLADNLVAFLNRDYNRVAVLHIKSGWVPSETRIDELEGAIRTVCEPLLDRPIHEISLGELLQRLFQIARSFDVEILPQLVLLQKTIINIEGIVRQLHPHLDLWETARPEMERWMSERMGVRGLIKGTILNLPRVIERLPELPNRAIDLIDKIYDGKIEMENKSEEIHKLREEMKIYNRKTILSVIGSGFILSSSIIYALNNTTHGAMISVPLSMKYI